VSFFIPGHWGNRKIRLKEIHTCLLFVQKAISDLLGQWNAEEVVLMAIRPLKILYFLDIELAV